MFTVFENKLDKFFEQFEVPREPVRSGMMAAVTQKLVSVWDRPEFSKYRKVSDAQVEAAYTQNYEKAVSHSTKIKSELPSVKTVTAELEPGVSGHTKATVNAISVASGLTKIEQVRTILMEIFKFMADQKPNLPPEKRAKQLLANIKAMSQQRNWKLTDQDINNIMYVIWEDPTKFTNIDQMEKELIDRSAKDTAQKAPA